MVRHHFIDVTLVFGVVLVLLAILLLVIGDPNPLSVYALFGLGFGSIFVAYLFDFRPRLEKGDPGEKHGIRAFSRNRWRYRIPLLGSYLQYWESNREYRKHWDSQKKSVGGEEEQTDFGGWTDETWEKGYNDKKAAILPSLGSLDPGAHISFLGEESEHYA